MIASHDEHNSSTTINQNASVYALLEEQQAGTRTGSEHHAWVQLVRGELDVNGKG